MSIKLRKVMAHGRTSGLRYIDYYETLDGRFQVRNHSTNSDRYWVITDTAREENLPGIFAHNFSLAEAKESIEIMLEAEDDGGAKRTKQKIIARAGDLKVVKVTVIEFGIARRSWFRLVRGPGLPARRCSTKKEAMGLFEKIKAGGGK